jgi:hypothetical protein
MASRNYKPVLVRDLEEDNWCLNDMYSELSLEFDLEEVLTKRCKACNQEEAD